MTQKQKIYKLALGTALLSLQFLFFVPGAEAQNNTPTNSTPANEQGRYVGRGVEASIRRLLCAPSDSSSVPTTNGAVGTTVAKGSSSSQDLSNCINRGYRFALAFGAVAAVFFFVLAGYMYMVGGENGKHEAKNVIISVIVGFLIMLSSFVLLQQINPTLVSFRTIQPPQLGGQYSLLPSCSDLKLGIGEDCQFEDGSPGVSNGNGGGMTPQGGTMTGKSGKVCSMGKDEDLQTHAKCSLDSRLENAFQAAARETGIDANFMKAIATKESHWDESAISWTRCCKGLMQMSDATAARFGCTGNDWKTKGEVIIPCAARYMKYLRDKYAGNDYVKIAAGYNAGEGRLSPSPNCPGMVVALCPFRDAAQTACIVGVNSLEQTRNYVVTVARFYNEYKQCR